MEYYENPAALRQAGYADAIQGGAGLHSYGEALWWTGMIMTTLGSQYWPITAEGRILCWLLALYAFSIFGSITAAIASFLVKGTAAEQHQQAADHAAAAADLAALQQEIAGLRSAMAVFTNQIKS